MPNIDDVAVDLMVVLGTTSMPVHQVLRLSRGAIIELDASEQDEVRVLANNMPVASEVGAAKTMLDRTAEQFDATPSRLVADGGYGSAEMVGWLVDERGIEPHVNLIDKSERTDGTFSRSDFTFDTERDLYVCPGGKELRKSRRAFSTPREGVAQDGAIRYRAAQRDCEACALKPKCCPNMLARKIARSVHEAARDKVRAIAKTEAYAVSCRERKKVEMLFAHLKRILRLGRLRLRGPNGAKDEFLLAATAQNLRKLAKLIPLPAPIFAT